MRAFFGAGTIGRRLLALGSVCGLKVDFFIDNNPELWGKTIEKIPVISVEELKKLPKEPEIFITCKDSSSIYQQLIDSKIDAEQIKVFDTTLSMLSYILDSPKLELPIKIEKKISLDSSAKVVFDLENGFVLGGVESWSLRTAQMLEKMGYQTAFITDGLLSKGCTTTEDNRISVPYSDTMNQWDRVETLLSLLLQENYNCFVCNFIGSNFMTACLAKKLFPDSVQLIAVVHNDEDAYYKYYTMMEPWIDKCFVISEKIKVNLMKMGFPEKKIKYLPWEIRCEDKFEHKYSSYGEKLRIGYAGRVVIKQKRMDYLISVANKLKKREIPFVLEIAGTGDYVKELKKEIEKNHLQSFVRWLGMVESGEIMNFWKNQDIMISCSDWEGHSISQGEAMAAGAVPIITDVSGARDDVADGKNGFIVEVGNMEQIIEKIVLLYNQRERLSEMGENAYKTIKEKNSRVELEKLWRDILK